MRTVSGFSLPAIALGVLLLSTPAWRVSAQAGPAPLEQLEVALWPEFDRAAMLVIYRFEIGAEVAPPTTVELPIPPEVGQPHAVAWEDDSGALFDAPFNVTPDGTVSISMPQGNRGQLEYYADLTFQDQQRSFRFEWPGTVALGGLSYEVQQPAGASALSITPPPQDQGPGPFGLNYATAELGPQPVGSQLTIELSYLKSSSSLSMPSQSEPLAPSPASAPASADLLPYLLAGGGVLLIAAGVIYYTRGRATLAPRPRSGGTPGERVAPAEKAELEVSAVYCHKCGAKAKINDSFCRNCGSRLRN